jgi:hypothetical protein
MKRRTSAAAQSSMRIVDDADERPVLLDLGDGVSVVTQ